MATALNETEIIDQFRLAMAERGIVVTDEIVADGKLHRVHVDGDRKKSRNGWYCLHSDGTPAGAFGSNRLYGSDAKFTWRADKLVNPLTPEERRAWVQEQARKKAEREAKELETRENAACHASFMWDQAQPCEGDDHPYLQRKGVNSYGLRVGAWEKIDDETGNVVTVSTKALLVPIRDIKKNIHSLQAIFVGKVMGDRDKDFVKGGAKSGLFYSFGKPQTVDVGGEQRQVIMIGEGYATLASAHECTGHAAIVAFDAGNLMAVGRVLRQRFADAVLLFLADNDQWTREPIENPGLTKAREAAAAVGGLMAVPPFLADDPKKPTDFNDLHALCGAGVVREIIEATVEDGERPARIVVASTEAEALGVAYALECIASLERALAAHVGASRAMPYTLVLAADNDLSRVAKIARLAYPEAPLHVLAAHGQKVEASRVAAEYGATLEMPPDSDEWAGWGECFLDAIFEPIDAAAAAQVVRREVARAGADEAIDACAAGHFAVLGFNGDKYYLFHHKKQLVLERSRTDFASEVGLVELAPRQWWEFNNFGRSRGGIDKVAAAEWIFGQAHASGHFDPENRMRGRGAWSDKGRSVFHHGDHLTVDGVPMDLPKIESRFIYENGTPLPAMVEQATSMQGAELLSTAQMMRWVNPASAMLLCGWVFLAPLSGALRWRPHIWITGEAGSGKSHILRDFAGRLLGSTKLAFDAGDSSAAGIRQKLKRDALPVVLDETESKDDKGRDRIRGILTMARGSSTDSDAMIAKGTVSGRALEFVVRSMFCLCSIGAIAQEQESDNSRFSTLALRNRSDTSATDQWAQLKPALAKIDLDEGLPARLLSRGILMLPTLHKCIEVFAAAVAKQLGSERYGDQYGTLLAGYWCLTRDEVVTDVEAMRIVDGIQWDDYFVDQRQATPDASKCLDAILDSIIMEKGSTVSIRALVALATGHLLEGYDIQAPTARRLLQDRGLTITSDEKRGRLLGVIRSSKAVAEMLRGTDFASDWQSQLPRVKGYVALKPTSFGSTGQNRGHGFPLSSIRLPDDPKHSEDEPTF